MPSHSLPETRRWYGHLTDAKPRGVVQVEQRLRDAARGRTGTGERAERLTLPERVLRLAHAEYRNQHGDDQDYERMQERGGLGVLEVVALLADYVERLGGEPTMPRKRAS